MEFKDKLNDFVRLWKEGKTEEAKAIFPKPTEETPKEDMYIMDFLICFTVKGEVRFPQNDALSKLLDMAGMKMSTPDDVTDAFSMSLTNCPASGLFIALEELIGKEINKGGGLVMKVTGLDEIIAGKNLVKANGKK
jgi:hypothetical protein